MIRFAAIAIALSACSFNIASAGPEVPFPFLSDKMAERDFQKFMVRSTHSNGAHPEIKAPGYKIEVETDLNSDGHPDFVISDQTSCGTAGCPYIAYIFDGHGPYHSVQTDLFGYYDQLFAAKSEGKWNRIIAQADLKEPVFDDLSYDEHSKSFTTRQILVCNSNKFSECASPVTFCPGGGGSGLRHNAHYYSKPSRDSQLVSRDSLEPSRIRGTSLDGKWFLVAFKESNFAYVGPEAVLGHARKQSSGTMANTCGG